MDRLSANQRLNVNDQLVAAGGKTKVVMQGDGNLVLYRTDNGKALWSSNTWNKPVNQAVMQGDGNLVCYGPDGQAYWSTGTSGQPGAWAILQDDGNFVLYGLGGSPLWASNTVQNWEQVTSAAVFRDTSRSGTTLSLALPAGQRYEKRRLLDLMPSLVHTIRSVELRAGEAEASLYLFAGNSQVPNGDWRRFIPYSVLQSYATVPFMSDFHGDFLRLTVPGGGPPFVVDDLTTLSFQGRTTSLMLVNRWMTGKQERTISARSTFTAPWDLTLSLAIYPIQVALGGGVAISRIQDPVFTWLAFPTRPGLVNTDCYMVVSQWFVFNAWGIGINVWLLFYLHFSVDNNRLALDIVDMDRYVWPGTGQGQVMQAIDGNKGMIISALQGLSTLAFQNITTGCDDVYLLPGTQPHLQATGDESEADDALNDVSIVLENPR